MATVHVGRLNGPVGFSRTVAIKVLHERLAKDREFASMFLDEARIVARIRHPNVVPTVDVINENGELFLVMEYVHGEPLSRLMRAARAASTPIPRPVVSAILSGVLHGLHAAHEATDERGEPLCIVHRDVSPQNILVGADGTPRLLDFGVAKAAVRAQTTREGQLKGKIAYMSPEQLQRGGVDRRSDVYAAGVVLWEALTLQRLFTGDSEAMVITQVLERMIEPPSLLAPDVPKELDAIALRALARDPTGRYETAREMALALEEATSIATPTRVAEWVDSLAGQILSERARTIANLESTPSANQDDDATRVEGSGREPGSQPSSVSVTARKRVAPPSNRRWPWILVAAGAGAGLTFVATTRLHMRAIPPPPATSAPPAVVTSAPPTSAPPTSAPPTSAPPTAVTSATPPPAPPASSVAPVKPNATSPRVPPSRAVAPGTRSGSADKPCTIRSFIDSAGIKHFVRDCG
jgi:serine/threonine-protein kinase